MARKHATLRVALLSFLASCAGPASWPDLSEPMVPADLEPLPEMVIAANARDVIRKCLQRHGWAETNAHRRYGYVFRDRGFIQLCRATDTRDEVARVYVDYAAVQGTSSRVTIDTARFRERVEVTVTGRFRRWQSRVTPYAAPPPLDPEPPTVEWNALVLPFDDALVARKLHEALSILMKKG